MKSSNSAFRFWALSVALLLGIALVIGGFAFALQPFGREAAVSLSLLLSLPLAGAVRLCWRWPAVQDRELAILVVLFCVDASSGWFVVREWYRAGLDQIRAEDLRWAEFESRFRQDPAFRDVQIHKSQRKDIHWASGSVATQADLDRLNSLAKECGIQGRRLDGPYDHSVSLIVRVE